MGPLLRRLAVVAVLAGGLVGVTLAAARLERPVPAGQIVFTRAPIDPSDPLDADLSKSDLYAINPDGSNMRLLVRNASAAAVAPDARRIAFERDFAIWIMRRDGSAQRQLTRLPKRLNGYDELPSWSPDGRTIYFSRYTNPRGESLTQKEGIFAVRADGSGLRLITYYSVHIDLPCLQDAAPSPAGRVIAFDVIDCEYPDISEIDAVTGAGRPAPLPFRFPGAVRFGFPGAVMIKDPGWAPDGHHLAYSGSDVPRRGHRTVPSSIYVSSDAGASPRKVATAALVSGPPSPPLAFNLNTCPCWIT